MKRIYSLLLAAVLTAGVLTGCGSDNKPAEATSATEEASASTDEGGADAEPTESADAETEPTESTGGEASGDFKASMITDVGGINDESFNQSAWAGMTKLKEDLGVEVSFIESKKEADYATNLDLKIDEDPDIIWGVGFLMKDSIREAAEANPDQLFGLIDDSFEDGELPNVISVIFNAEQSSFEVGYAAAQKTETNHVGFVLGMESPTMDRFKYGYFAGVEYGAKELGKEIKIDFSVVEAFDDSAKGKGMAQKMYTDGADVIFHAAGQSGMGVIEAAKEMDKMVIGVDLDQNKLAPDNVITSGLKNVDVAIFDITKKVMDGEQLGGTTVNMGLAENGVGIAPSSNVHLSEDILTAIEGIAGKIVSGEIQVPYAEEAYNAYVESLK